MSASEPQPPQKKQPRLEDEEKKNIEAREVPGEPSKLTQESMLSELKQLQSKLTSLLCDAQEDVRTSIQDFFADKVLKMGGLIGHYHAMLSSLGVQSRAEVEASIGKFYQDKEIQDAAEELFESEEEWNLFLKDVDKKIQPCSGGESTPQTLVVGEPISHELKMTEVQSGRKESLKECQGSMALVLIFLRHFA